MNRNGREWTREAAAAHLALNGWVLCKVASAGAYYAPGQIMVYAYMGMPGEEVSFHATVQYEWQNYPRFPLGANEIVDGPFWVLANRVMDLMECIPDWERGRMHGLT